MKNKFRLVKNGSITTPKGYLAGATCSNIKKDGALDLGILYSEVPCNVAGVFTTNAIKASPVLLTQQNIRNSVAQALVVNSGCANACTGKQGMIDAKRMAVLTANKLMVKPDDVLVASTGVIGMKLPINKIEEGIKKIKIERNGGKEFAKSILTTDTVTKEIAISVNSTDNKFIIGGCAKGSGMIHPNLATLLCFITTDAYVSKEFLHISLIEAVSNSFNMITIDGDTSTNDTIVLFSNGMSSRKLIKKNNGNIFQEALNIVCQSLAKLVARDGEGATKLLEVIIEGAATEEDAKIMARSVATSPLVKSAMHGNDPNWGRVAAAIGRSGGKVVENKLDIFLNDICVMRQGLAQPFNKVNLVRSMAETGHIKIKAHINLGIGKAIAWGCDLSEEYVTINSAYTT